MEECLQNLYSGFYAPYMRPVVRWPSATFRRMRSAQARVLILDRFTSDQVRYGLNSLREHIKWGVIEGSHSKAYEGEYSEFRL